MILPQFGINVIYSKVYNKTKSKGSSDAAQSAIASLDLYCKDKYNKDTAEQVLAASKQK